ncbi:hypothetical protein KVR01_012263 [Diaporthe batatas]|uniref:uncharacterized protein n=1 Tax=Diaporthe batatas TaxID=748121 RepID=UPI001D041852|nr:uncharacterized protein KVR01_012263 [Diaporthe batatas]KAG8157991.1 hypothetical protein KVR01_012263 [Diaporthe batatas]
MVIHQDNHAEMHESGSLEYRKQKKVAFAAVEVREEVSSTQCPLTLPTTRVPMESNEPQRHRSNSDGCDEPSRCIESLPAEIQRHIMLCLPSLGSLGACILSSPVFYSLFQSEPKNYIANCLINILGDTFVDASTARAAIQDSFQQARCAAMKAGHETRIIWPFLETYREHVQHLSCKDWIHSISLPEAVEMATFQTSIVEPLVDEYACWALANLSTSAKAMELSKIERIRIQRAMYRFQIVCDVFGNKLEGNNMANQRLRQLGCLRFLAGYDPWEIEEMLCINAFFQQQYQKRLLEVSGDLDPVVWGSPGEPGEEISPVRLHMRSSSRNFLVSQGLPLMASVLRIRDREELAATLRANMDSGYRVWHMWLDDVTGNTDMNERWERSYSERDLAQDEQRPIPFRGDSPDSPPLAWVLIWGETYSNLFGIFIPKPLHLWGYIMWDARRMEETGARERLMREWDDMWQGGDYRDTLRAWNNAWNNRG